MSARLAVAVACVGAAIVFGPIAQADVVNGPRAAAPGKTVSFRLVDFPEHVAVSVTIQPAAYRGGNCCGRLLDRRWRTTSSGTAMARFRWPSRWLFCSAGDCTRHRWRPGQRAYLDFCYTGSSGAVECASTYVRIAASAVPAVADLRPPIASASAVCADYPNQAAAQRAADTRDSDGDGVYCESLPCPCAGPGSTGGGAPKAPAPRPIAPTCVRIHRTANITFSSTKYPNIRRHYLRAIARGWPRILVVNRRGADARRGRLLSGYPARRGYDRDEYPPAVGRGHGKYLERGTNPLGWRADVAYVPSAENRSHGSTMGIKLRRYCNGQRFRYVFY